MLLGPNRDATVTETQVKRPSFAFISDSIFKLSSSALFFSSIYCLATNLRYCLILYADILLSPITLIIQWLVMVPLNNLNSTSLQVLIKMKVGVLCAELLQCLLWWARARTTTVFVILSSQQVQVPRSWSLYKLPSISIVFVYSGSGSGSGSG